MGFITDIIEPRAFEQVRDRIGEILVFELLGQSELANDPSLNAKVFLERTVPFGHEELPAVNLMLSRGDFDNMTTLSKDGTYSFDIDVYDCAKTKSDVRGDSAAMLKVHKLIGIIHAILSHPRYITLYFARPFIEHTQVSGFKIADPQNVKDAASIMMGRVTFLVRVPESNKIATPTDLALNATTIKLHDSEQGYYYDFLQAQSFTFSNGEDILFTNNEQVLGD